MNSNTKPDFYSHLQRSGSNSMNIDLNSHLIALDAAKDSLEFYNDMMEHKVLDSNTKLNAASNTIHTFDVGDSAVIIGSYFRHSSPLVGRTVIIVSKDYKNGIYTIRAKDGYFEEGDLIIAPYMIAKPNDMKETSKDIYDSGAMSKETMEKFQEPRQTTTNESWWNGARAALGLPFDTPRSEVSENFLSKPKPSLEDFLNVLHESVELSSSSELKDAIKLIIEVQAMDSGMRDCIRAAFLNGPLDDGDVPSKSGRNALLENDYISKIVVKGEEGFNALTYKGARAYRLIKAGA